MNTITLTQSKHHPSRCKVNSNNNINIATHMAKGREINSLLIHNKLPLRLFYLMKAMTLLSWKRLRWSTNNFSLRPKPILKAKSQQLSLRELILKMKSSIHFKAADRMISSELVENARRMSCSLKSMWILKLYNLWKAKRIKRKQVRSRVSSINYSREISKRDKRRYHPGLPSYNKLSTRENINSNSNCWLFMKGISLIIFLRIILKAH